MIRVDRLTRNYNSFTAVSDLSSRVERGEVPGLVGPKGAGNTTTLRCIAGIILTTVGRCPDRQAFHLGRFDHSQACNCLYAG